MPAPSSTVSRTGNTKNVIPDFGKKLDFLQGIIGYALPAHRFDNSNLAEALGTSDAQMSRKKIGKAAVNNTELSRIIEQFNLGPELTFEIFFLDFEEYCATLRRHKIGTYGLDDGGSDRQKLLNDKQRRNNCIRMMFVSRRRGGLGLSDSKAANASIARIGDEATLRIELPGPGHLLLFNDALRGTMECLLPSCFGRDTSVGGGSVKFPTDDSVQPALDVVGPPGWYRVFAIWTEQPLSLPWVSGMTADEPPVAMKPSDLRYLTAALESLRDRNAPYLIFTAEYRVAD